MPTDPTHQIPALTSDLVRVHRELAELLVAAADPIAERQTAARRRALTARRAELLEAFGHLGLACMMAGGTVELVRPS